MLRRGLTVTNLIGSEGERAAPEADLGELAWLTTLGCLRQLAAGRSKLDASSVLTSR
jgi:hypothetical protein